MLQAGRIETLTAPARVLPQALSFCASPCAAGADWTAG